MRLPLALLPLWLAAACASDVKGPDGAPPNPGACTDAACADPLPVGDPGGEGEGDVGGEGEGDVFAGEGEGEGDVVGGEGEGEGEGDPGPSGPQTLLATAGPQLVDALPGCPCTPAVPASNVDIALVAQSGGTCAKPADQSCGIDGGKCSCGLAGAQWFVSRQEEPRTNEVWPVDEAVEQDTAADGTYTVRASVVDDCLLSPASTAESVNYSCFDLDCEGDFGAPAACFDYTQLGGSCALAASSAASVVTNADCMARGPVPVRVHVEVPGGFTREFCTTMSAGGTVNAVQLRRSNGVYTVVSVDPAMTEVAVGAACP